MEHKTFSNSGDRFETENLTSRIQQSEFDSLFEAFNTVNNRNRERRDNNNEAFR